MTTSEFTTEGMYKELADSHIAGKEEIIKTLEADAKTNSKEKDLHKEAIARLKSEIAELKKVKVGHKDLKA